MKHFIKAAAFLSVLVALMLGGLYWYLTSSPLILNSYASAIEREFEKLAPGLEMHFANATLEWPKFFKPLRIRLKELKVYKKGDQKALAAEIPEMQLKFNLFHILEGRLWPSVMQIHRPELNMTYAPDQESSFLFASTSKEEFIGNLLDQFVNHADFASFLKKIEIIEGRVIVENLPEEFHFWQKQTVNLGLARGRHGYEGHVEIKGEDLSISGMMHFSPKEGRWKAELSFSQLPVANFISLLSNNYKDKLTGLTLLLSGTGDLTYSKKEGLENFQLSVESTSGQWDNLKIFEGPLPIDAFRFAGEFSNHQIRINTLTFTSKEAQGHLEGKIDLNRENKTAHVDVIGGVENVPIDDLKFLWPKGLAEVPRDWVTNNIKKAKVPAATLVLKSDVHYGDDQIKVDIKDLHGEIDILNARVRYLEKMPMVEGVNGKAWYDDKTFRIVVTSGTTFKQNIKNGEILITDLDVKDQNITIDLDVMGPFSEALQLLDHEPMGYAKSLGLLPAHCSGEGTTKLHLAFPLERKTTFKELKIESESRLTSVGLLNPISQVPATLQEGEFLLKVNNDKLSAEGKALINRLPAKITWQKNFDEALEIENTLTVESSIDSFGLAKLGFLLEDNLKGQAPLTLQYQSKGEKAHLSFKCNLEPVDLFILGIEKTRGLPGEFKAKIDFENGKPRYFKDLSLTAKDLLNVVASGSFDKSGKGFETVDFASFKLGKTEGKLHLKRNKMGVETVYFDGLVFDLEPILEYLEKSSQTTFDRPVDIRLRADQLYMGPHRLFHNSSIYLGYSQDKIRHLEGDLYLSAQAGNRLVKIRLKSNNDHQRSFELSTNHAGNFMSIMDWSENVRGGVLKIKASHDGPTTEPWQGTIKLKDFALIKAPLLGKLLTLAFPTGFMELFSDDGLRFNLFNANFQYTPEKLLIKDGRAAGTSLGISVSGLIYPKQGKLALQGNLIPAYFLNTLLNKIPLLGELLTGGKNEGLFAVSYSMSGDMVKPKISVNPLSVLTPGIIRKIFSTEDEDPQELQSSRK
ncbi:YhdP family protein [Candidatus Nucleicultrix amoebiphila]|uniref:YhdP family protein n=1 Tax=Candidatus Nucleicultrix amoebiphila TaxID=1509244 RepID=UPI000A268A9F|nr:AsmA-like C-terminal domain-containing protein [Candidatus Nucleicultrix amoebiphila]